MRKFKLTREERRIEEACMRGEYRSISEKRLNILWLIGTIEMLSTQKGKEPFEIGLSRKRLEVYNSEAR